MGAEVELNQSLAAVGSNPNDASARAHVEQAVNALKAWVTPSNATPELAKQLARGNEVLGKREQAVKWATAAHEKLPNSAPAPENLRGVASPLNEQPNLASTVSDRLPVTGGLGNRERVVDPLSVALPNQSNEQHQPQ